MSTPSVDQDTPATGSAESELRRIPLTQIQVIDGFNPRGDVTEDEELQALAQTIRDHGCLLPIRVKATSDGTYQLIAGERRYRAAILAGLTEIPASIITAHKDEPDGLLLLTEAMVENELRSDLDPLQRARGYQAMIDRGLTVRGVAERLGGRRRSREQRIREHLTILKLPDDLARKVALGDVPLLAINALVGLCEIHPDLARAAVSVSEPDEDFGESYSWTEIVETPLGIAAQCCEPLPDGVFVTRNAYPITRFTLSEKAISNLAAYQKLTGRDLDTFRFGADDADRAEQLGAGHNAGWFHVIAGQDVADRLIEDQIAANLKAARAAARTGKQDKGTAAGHGIAGEISGEEERGAEERERQRQIREQATTFNLQLGVLALKHLSRIKADERVLRIMSSVDLGGSLRRIAARGAWLCLPGWVEQTHQANGRTKTSYLEPGDTVEKANEFLAGAGSSAEIAGRTIVLLALAAYASEDAVAQSRRSYCTLTYHGPWAGQAAKDLAEIVRERIKEGQLPALDELLAESGKGT